MDKKLLFLDLDGTLLNDSKQISPGNRRALEAALQRGHGVIITTGRALSSARHQAQKLRLDQPGCFLAAYNGAVIYDWREQRNLFSATLPSDLVCQVFDYANTQGVHIQTYDDTHVLVEHCCDDAAVRRYCDLTGMQFRVVDSVRRDLQKPPVKLLLIDYECRTGLLAAERWINTQLAGKADCFFSSPDYLEVVPPGINKGEAVKLLCEKLAVPLENAVAAGDAANDLSMILTAGTGVAMANGTPEVIAAADYVTVHDNNHDGIAEVVELFLK